MKFRLVKILILISLIFSTAELFNSMGILSISLLHELDLVYILFSIFTLLIVYIALILIGRQKPKEIVKVVYKTVEAKTDKDDTKKKEIEEKQIINRYVSLVTKDLDKFLDSTEDFSDQLFTNLSAAFDIVTGMIFLWDETKQVYFSAGYYAYYQSETYKEYKLGEGITGQVAKDKRNLYLDNVPDGYITVVSGLGKGTPKYLTLLAIVHNKFTIGVVEFATFNPIPEPHEKILKALADSLENHIVKLLEQNKIN